MAHNDIEVTVQQFGPVTRIRLGRRLFGKVRQAVNVYWVDGLLIDSGAPRHTAALIDALAQRGLTIEQLVNTHAHEDHIGGNAFIADRYGIAGHVHPLGITTVEQPPTRLPFYREQVWGTPRPASARPLGHAVRTDRYRFDVIHTPGHAPDHVVLFEPAKGWLFTGDLYLSPTITMVMATEDPLLMLQSMRNIAALPVQQLFCQHARDVPNSAAPIAEKIRRWEALATEARRLAEAGWPLPRITRKLLGPFHSLELISAGEYHRRNLIRGLLGQQAAQ